MSLTFYSYLSANRSNLTISAGWLRVIVAPLALAVSFNLAAEQSSDSQLAVIKDVADELFKSRLQFNSEGRPDISQFSQCFTQQDTQASDLTNTVDYTKKPDRWQISYQSAPEISQQRSHLLGQVRIQDSLSIITAEEVVIDHRLQTVTASGGVSVESSDAFFSADSLRQQRTEQKVSMENAQFLLFTNSANGKAKRIEIQSQKNTLLQDLTFSTCSADQQTWQLATSEMNIDQQAGRGEAWNTVLKVSGVPVFYFPYLNFPIDRQRRKSGLLTPSYRKSNENGIDLAIPFYWNIAPAFDATITPRNIEKRGFQLATEFRWLTENSHSELYVEWMNKDKIVAQSLENPPANVILATDSANRWVAKIDHEANFNDAWRVQLDAQKVSDSDYFRDFSSGLENSNATQLNSLASISYQNNIWDVELFSLTQQSLIGEQYYEYLPSLNAAADYLGQSGVRWQMSAEWSQFRNKDVSQLEGARSNLMPSVSYPLHTTWGYAVPKLSYQLSQYTQQSRLTGETIKLSRSLPILSFDSGLYFDRESQWSGADHTHTLSPRIFYSYIPYREQSQFNLFDTTLASFDFNQLWRSNRFSGVDKVGDTNHLSVALANTLIRNQSGEQVFDFVIGRKHYFDDRLIQLNGESISDQNASAWLAKLDFKLTDKASYQGFIEWDQRLNRTNQATNRIKFEPSAKHIVNVTHRYREIDGRVSEESDFSFALPIKDRWRVVGRWYNDLKRDRLIEALAGIEYESCCWAVRLVAQKYLSIQLDSAGMPVFPGANQYNSDINLQFVFKGLGGAGQSGLNALLESSIAGYRDPFLNNGF